MTVEETTTRTYGNFRKPRASGLRGLSLGTTLLLLAGLIAVVLTTLVSVWAALLMAVSVAMVTTALAFRDRHDRTLMKRGAVRLAWWRTTRSGGICTGRVRWAEPATAPANCPD